jgi:nitrous oxidase accessory protein NosD
MSNPSPNLYKHILAFRIGHPAYTTIQAAVNAAQAGTTILVDPGTYNENVTISQQGITLDGAQAGVNLVAGRSGPESLLDGTITITGANVTVAGFKVNASSQWAIEVGGASPPSVPATNSIIENNIVYSTVYGIQIGAQRGPSTQQVPLYSLVQNNVVQSGNAEIWVPSSSYTTIQRNLVSMKQGQAGSGIELYYSTNDVVFDNEIDNSPTPGDLFTTPLHRLRS